MVMKVILPVRTTLGMGARASATSPLQPNQMPPLSRSAASTPTAKPPAVAALVPVSGVTRLETTTRRLTASAAGGSDDLLPGLAELHGAIDDSDQWIGLREVAPELIGLWIDVLRE